MVPENGQTSHPCPASTSYKWFGVSVFFFFGRSTFQWPLSFALLANMLLFAFQADNNMKKYGKSLVNAVPEKATELLKVLCTDYRPKGVYSDGTVNFVLCKFLHCVHFSSQKVMNRIQ